MILFLYREILKIGKLDSSSIDTLAEFVGFYEKEILSVSII